MRIVQKSETLRIPASWQSGAPSDRVRNFTAYVRNIGKERRERNEACMIIRNYRPEDEPPRLRCRVPAFLDTACCGHVLREKERYGSPSIEPVAEEDGCWRSF